MVTRRDFLKYASIGGLALVAPRMLGCTANAMLLDGPVPGPDEYDRITTQYLADAASDGSVYVDSCPQPAGETIRFTSSAHEAFLVIHYAQTRAMEAGGYTPRSLTEAEIMTTNNVKKYAGQPGNGTVVRNNSVIVIDENLGQHTFERVLFHETGHYLRDTSKEYASVGNELFSALTACKVLPEIGAYLLARTFGLVPPEERTSVHSITYDHARIHSIWNLMATGGNIAESQQHILEAPINLIDAEKDSIISEAENQVQIMYILWQHLIDNGLTESFISDGNLSVRQAHETVDFIRILNLYHNGILAMDFEEARAHGREIAENFLINRYNQNSSMEEIVRELTGIDQD